MLHGPDTRLRLVTALLIAALLPILGQLLRIQVLEHPYYQREVDVLVRRRYALPDPPWGLILDRNGDLLVGNIPVYDIGAEVNLITDTLYAAQVLSPLLNMPEEELQATLTPPTHLIDTMPRVVWRPLANHVSADAAQSIAALGFHWVTMTPAWERYYAEGDLAAHVLGFVNQEGKGYGLQACQMRFLRGEGIDKTGIVDGTSSPLPGELAKNVDLPYPGTDLRLTLDRTIQAYVEGELERAVETYNAEGGSVLVMNPRNGELLATASYPSYEPYHYPMYAAEEKDAIFIDPAVSVAFEPGSIFKVLTVAAALDSGKVNLDWSYEDRGSLEYGGVIVRNSNNAHYGKQDLEGILAHSLNVGASTLSVYTMGSDIFYQYVRAFGFGQPTDVDVAGEAAGQVHLPTDWDWADSYLATNAFGQGIAVTPLQIATAVSAVANEGIMMQPHVVAERYYPDGRRVTIPPRPLGQPISKETALTLTDLMVRAVERDVEAIDIPGYRIAGKTGTAQIPTTGGYDPEDVIASFIGFGPIPDPQVLILVKLDRPDVPEAMRWGSKTAAPVFQVLASRLFVLLGIPPSDFISAN